MCSNNRQTIIDSLWLWLLHGTVIHTSKNVQGRVFLATAVRFSRTARNDTLWKRHSWMKSGTNLPIKGLVSVLSQWETHQVLRFPWKTHPRTWLLWKKHGVNDRTGVAVLGLSVSMLSFFTFRPDNPVLTPLLTPRSNTRQQSLINVSALWHEAPGSIFLRASFLIALMTVGLVRMRWETWLISIHLPLCVKDQVKCRGTSSLRPTPVFVRAEQLCRAVARTPVAVVCAALALIIPKTAQSPVRTRADLISSDGPGKWNDSGRHATHLQDQVLRWPSLKFKPRTSVDINFPAAESLSITRLPFTLEQEGTRKQLTRGQRWINLFMAKKSFLNTNPLKAR